MDNSFASVIDSAESILVLLPTRPYFDQVAAGLSLFLSLQGRKTVDISCPTSMLVEYNRLVGVDKISSDLGSKNMVIRFVDYNAKNVERVSAEIDDSKNEFYLTLVPKPGVTSPKKEQVTISSSGVSADTIFLVGGGSEHHFPALTDKDLVGVKVAHIGIREISTPQAKGVLSFARPGSCISEIVGELIKDANLTLDSDIATNLLMGIEDTTKNYSGEGVTAETFDLVAELLRKGGKRANNQPVDVKKYPPGSIPGKSIQTKKGEKTASGWLEPKIYKGTAVS